MTASRRPPSDEPAAHGQVQPTLAGDRTHTVRLAAPGMLSLRRAAAPTGAGASATGLARRRPGIQQSYARSAACGVAAACAVAAWTALLDPPAPADSAPAYSRRGVVVSAHGLASTAGADLLRRGGNAVDAAIATGLALAVVHPAAGNLGGGGFMLIRLKGGRSTALDFREIAPRGAHPGMFLDPHGRYQRDLHHEGYRAVGVPGTVAGFDLARERYGTRSWRELCEPAERLAAEGFPLSRALARSFAARQTDWRRYPSSARVFLKPDGTTLEAGDVWRQPDLARTLRTLQRGGREAFYRGALARLLAADMRRHGGLITEADLADYQAKERAPIRGAFRGCEIVSMPPPSSGGIGLIEMLNILQGDSLRDLGHNSAAYLHLLAETMRRAYADRARHLGDPDSNPGLPVSLLLSPDRAARLRRSIRPDWLSVSDPAAFTDDYESPETTHYSVVDAAGNAVSVTYTLEAGYGSRIVADGLGFLYNNEMGDFNGEPGRTDRTGLIGTPPNLAAPGKRMLSSMTPTIVAKDGEPYLVLGSPGGRTIINTVLQVLLNVVEFDMDLGRAVARGRIHHQWLPNELVLERDATSTDTLRLLREKGHQLRFVPSQGSVMAILVEPGSGERNGVTDPREPDGAAAAE